MALQVCGLTMNSTRRELKAHGTVDFPCAGYSKLYTDRADDVVFWHWHDEMEIMYVRTGRLLVRVPQKTYLLNEGEAVVVNADVLHYAAADPLCRLDSLVFSPALITGSDRSVYAQKYILPLTSCSAFDGYVLRRETDGPALRAFVRAFDALANDTPGFEFAVRDDLSKLCFALYQQLKPRAGGDTGASQNDFRMHGMLSFIQENYARDITLTDIAGAAGVSERECLRCFQRSIQTSPMQYLLKYRIMRGAALLLEHPSSTISEVAISCGFNSPSNFAKMFRRFYHCTPRAYRSAARDRDGQTAGQIG